MKKTMYKPNSGEQERLNEPDMSRTYTARDYLE